ncbi:hypothetical protein CAEBREN_01898 [Caenorhabditis brenneri]|uniref:Sdz-33 F-box domain-containing protein n=1 Tax=Caenorhabditis brenneri TaxID=135651 RepID=G0MGE0_CAEBE|nr:hypothetical protein CAEBREN_01898 [Caenorhabditis brenneri]
MSTFPLFRLPLVSLAVVVNHFHLNHLINISFCSQKSRKLLKALRRKTLKISIKLLCTERNCIYLSDRFHEDILPGENLDKTQYSSISIESKGNFPDARSLKIGDMLVPMSNSVDKHGEINLRFHFDDVFDGLKTISRYICSFLENPVYGLMLSSDFHPDQIRRTIDWAVSFQKSVERCYIEDYEISDHNFRNVLDVCNSINKFYFHGKLSPEFRHQFTFENDSITLMNSFWVNLDNLLSVNCRRFTVWGSNLTNLEVNQYLKHWKMGKFPNESNRDVTINYGFDIQTENGTLTTIVHEGGNFISKWFYMVVW